MMHRFVVTLTALVWANLSFAAVEINASFHGVPREETLQNWTRKAKKGFVFSFKVPQAITHEKRLHDIDDAWNFFLQRLVTGLSTLPGNDNSQQTSDSNTEQAKGEGLPIPPNLGPILFQLPPSLPRNVNKLREIAALVPKGLKVAFEFRHPSWYNDEEVIQTMRRHDFSMCQNISPDDSTLHTKVVTAATWSCATCGPPSTT